VRQRLRSKTISPEMMMSENRETGLL